MTSHCHHQLDDEGVPIVKQRKLKVLKQRFNVVYLSTSIFRVNIYLKLRGEKTVTTITVNGVEHIVLLNTNREM